MDALEAIMTRRSMRHFTSEPITDEQVQILLRAAMQAPSACNQQPWHFIIVNSRAKLNDITLVHPYAQMLKQAPIAVIVCADMVLETCPGNWVIDCSAATQNLLLAAHAIGLAGVWVGIHPLEGRVKDFREIFNLPTYVTPLCLVALGHAAEPLPEADRYKPERVHTNWW